MGENIAVMTGRRTYTPEQKAAALARVLAGESVSGVAREMGIERVTLQQWLAREKSTVTAVVTRPTLQARLAVALDTMLVTLTTQSEHYGSPQFLAQQPAATLMESTRTVGGIFIRIMDRLGGQPAPAGDRDDD